MCGLKSGLPFLKPKILRTKGAHKNKTMFKIIAKRGRKSRSQSNLICNRAMNMVAGSAKFKMTALMPAISCLDLSFVLSKNPIRIKSKKTMVFCSPNAIPLHQYFFYGTCKKLHFIYCAHTHTAPFFAHKLKSAHTNLLFGHLGQKFFAFHLNGKNHETCV